MKEDVLKVAINSAKELCESSGYVENENVLTEAIELIEECGIAMVGSHGDDGYPNIKAMLKIETDGIRTFWFSTNTSSKRVAQFLNDPKACVYFADQKTFRGLMLTGEMEVLTDIDSRKRLWREGCEVYYPLGVEDPDYTVLRFTARQANYYQGLSNITFAI